jgi:hypothetical protein
MLFPAQLSTRLVCETARTSGGFDSGTWQLHAEDEPLILFAGHAHDAKPFVFVIATVPTCALPQTYVLQLAAITHFQDMRHMQGCIRHHKIERGHGDRTLSCIY